MENCIEETKEIREVLNDNHSGLFKKQSKQNKTK